MPSFKVQNRMKFDEMFCPAFQVKSHKTQSKIRYAVYIVTYVGVSGQLGVLFIVLPRVDALPYVEDLLNQLIFICISREFMALTKVKKITPDVRT